MSKSHWSVIMRLSNILEAFVDRKLIVGTLNPPAAHDTSDDHRNPLPPDQIRSGLESIKERMVDGSFSEIRIVEDSVFELKITMNIRLKENEIITGRIYYHPNSEVHPPYRAIKDFRGTSQHARGKVYRDFWYVDQVIRFLLSDSPQRFSTKDEEIWTAHVLKIRSELRRIVQRMVDPRFSDIRIVSDYYYVLKITTKIRLQDNNIITGNIYYDIDSHLSPYLVVKDYKGTSQHSGAKVRGDLWKVNRVIQFLLSD
jgi:hypothetical protein